MNFTRMIIRIIPVLLAAIFGLVYGVRGLKKSKTVNKGKAMSIAAIVISCIDLLLFLLPFIEFFIYVFL